MLSDSRLPALYSVASSVFVVLLVSGFPAASVATSFITASFFSALTSLILAVCAASLVFSAAVIFFSSVASAFDCGGDSSVVLLDLSWAFCGSIRFTAALNKSLNPLLLCSSSSFGFGMAKKSARFPCPDSSILSIFAFNFIPTPLFSKQKVYVGLHMQS